MLDPHSKAKVENSTLPGGYTWGCWSGDYRIIERDGREVCRVGGVIARVESGDNMTNEVRRAIFKGERELAL